MLISKTLWVSSKVIIWFQILSMSPLSSPHCLFGYLWSTVPKMFLSVMKAENHQYFCIIYPHILKLLCSQNKLFTESCNAWKANSQFSHSVMSDSLRPRGLQHTRFPCHHQLPELTQTHVHWVSDAIQPSHSLSSPSPLAFNLFQHEDLFKWGSSSHQVVKVLEFWLQHKLKYSNEYSGLISFRIDWLDLLAVHGTLTSLFQHHSSKASISSAFSL